MKRKTAERHKLLTARVKSAKMAVSVEWVRNPFAAILLTLPGLIKA